MVVNREARSFDLPFVPAPKREKSMVPSVQGKVVKLELDKVTAGAVRYAELNLDGNPINTDVDGAVVSYIYVRKSALRKLFGYTHVPRTMTVTMSLAD